MLIFGAKSNNVDPSNLIFIIQRLLRIKTIHMLAHIFHFHIFHPFNLGVDPTGKDEKDKSEILELVRAAKMISIIQS